MPNFSARSLERLRTCHEDLQRLFLAVIEEYDCTILEGHRGQAAQDKAFAEGKSKLRWPNGKHNKMPSMAVDVAPYPIDWNNTKRFKEMAVVVKRVAAELGIDVKWGGDWKSFVDMPHWEL